MIYQFRYIHDRPATEDTLGRADFANALSNSLVLPKDSHGLVIGIEGNWGSGKSTLIGLIKENLKNKTGDNKPIIVDFNPWVISGTGAQVEALIGQIAASIDKEFSSSDKGVKVGEKLLSFVGLIGKLKHLKMITHLLHGTGAEAISYPLQKIGEIADEGANAGKETLKEVKKLLPSLDLSRKKDEVIEALSKLDRPLIVVIDDLDRLPREEIRSMMQVLKAVADFPQVTYLLAYDRNIIARALGRKIEEGLSYLEKIVQVAYPIPPLSQLRLKRFADEKIKNLLQSLEITLRNFENGRCEKAMVLAVRLARHPRDIIRVVNRLALSLPATYHEVNVADVIVFEALSQRFPKLRELIHSHPEDFIGFKLREDLVDENSWEEFIENRDRSNEELPWVKHLPQDVYDQRISKAACEFLFPPKEEGTEQTNYEDELRIADPDRLARLFRMTSLEDVPEAKDIHAMLSDPEKLEEALTLAIDENERFTLLEWLVNYLPSCKNPNVQGCIEKIVKIYGNLVIENEVTDQAVIEYSKPINKLLRLKKRGYKECFMSIVNNAPLSLAEKIMLRAADDQGKWPIKPVSVDKNKQIIPNSDLVNEAIEKWIKRVRESSVLGALHKEVNLLSILYRYMQFTSNKEAFGLVESLCETKDGLVAFLKYFKQGQSIDPSNDPLELIVIPARIAVLISENDELKSSYQWLIDLLGK